MTVSASAVTISGTSSWSVVETTGCAEYPAGTGTVHMIRADRTVLIGAWTSPLTPGCWNCALLWNADVTPETSLSVSHSAIPALWDSTLRGILGKTVAEGELWTRRLCVIDLDSGTITVNAFVPHPGCQRCLYLDPPASNGRPDLSATQATVPGQLRTRELDPGMLRSTLLDFRFGPIAHVYRDEESPLALVTAEAVVPGRAIREGGYGRSTNFRTSEVAALLEGVERVAGGYRHPTQAVEYGSYRELRADAVDPRTLGTHDPKWTGHSEFGYDTFHVDSPTSWVWGWSTLEERPLLVPEHVAYWHEKGRGSRFLYESSNGCAVGNTLEEAVLHGLFEVAERDAFLLAWYSRSRLAEIDVQLTGTLAHTRDTLLARGFNLQLLDMTTELGIPSVLSIVTASDAMVRAGEGPALSLASGSHLDPAKALGAAVEEAATNSLMYSKWVSMRPSVSVTRCTPMLRDFSRVRTLEDHTGMHGLVEARPLSDFLTHPSKTVTYHDFATTSVEKEDDLAPVLARQLEAVHHAGMDVLIVDQSNPYLRDKARIHAVKVIVPGAIPMTFGHAHQRTRGLPRLLRAAALIRGAEPTEGPGLIAPVPHPFP